MAVVSITCRRRDAWDNIWSTVLFADFEAAVRWGAGIAGQKLDGEQWFGTTKSHWQMVWTRAPAK